MEKQKFGFSRIFLAFEGLLPCSKEWLTSSGSCTLAPAARSPPSRCSACCWWIKTFSLSARARFVCSRAGREDIPRGRGRSGASRVHTGAGMCRRTERWERPRQSSASSPDKIVPQIPKAGLGLSNLAPKTAPAYVSRAGAAALIPRNRELCSRICHSDLHGGGGGGSSTRERGARGVWGVPSPPGAAPCSCRSSARPQKSRAGLAVALHGCRAPGRSRWFI